VFPLVTGREGVREKITRISRTIYNELLKARIRAYYDDEGSIGKRYVRADEIGIPYAITVDYQTIEDKTVTIRFRDTREQIRVSLEQLYDKILELLGLKHSIKIEI
ncbi:MAG: His/Gly/Thr/Pro-type tRNA ligase C-terminal domain-containing protein, partial [Desulfurococcaceae archaeon]